MPANPLMGNFRDFLATRLEAWKSGPWHLVLVALWCGFFLMLNYLPLRGTDLWGHVIYGRWILDHRALPTEDLLLPLAAGMSVVDSAWLSQVVFAQVERFGGAEALSNLFSVMVLATYLVLARTYFLQARNLAAAMLATLGALIVGWSRLTTIRPENFAVLCFAGLLWLIVSSSGRGDDADRQSPLAHPWRFWLGIPAVMALWVNLHGSFPCGLAVVGCFLVGEAVETAVRTRSLWAVAAQRSVRRWLVVTELALAATLVNPYGIDLLLATIRFSANENLRDLVEWQPLVILGIGGREFALSWVVLLVVLRHSRRPVPVAHGLLLGVFALAAVGGIRMLSWYAPVFGLVIAPHLPEALARAARLMGVQLGKAASGTPAGASQSWKYSIVCILIVWIAFTFSGLSRPVLGGKPRSTEQLYGPTNPLGITKHLRERPPTGQVFNPQHWGDWIVWDGPPGVRPFMTGNIHLAPPRVWQDYNQIFAGQSNWQVLLDRYRVTTVIVDKERQGSLLKLLRDSRVWTLRYDDEQAAVYTRSAAPVQQESSASK